MPDRSMACGSPGCFTQDTSGSGPPGTLPGQTCLTVHSSYSDLFRERKHTLGRCMRHLTYRSSNPDCTLQGDRISPVSQTRRLKSRVKSLLRSRPGHT